MIKKEKMKIAKQTEIAENIFELTLQGGLVSEMTQPGQFVHVKTGQGSEPLLRRPISICSINSKENQFTMIYRADGKGTALLSEKKENDSVDVLGPLGNGFPVEKVNAGDNVLLAGGGIGVPPLYELSCRLKKRGANVLHTLGFQTKKAVFYERQFAKLGETRIATADGTYGKKGFVTDIMDSIADDFDFIFSCGPTLMLKELAKRYEDKNLYLSLEERMGCGIGACFACVCRTGDDHDGTGYRKVCSDGPVFRAGEVIL
ncbi:dihydroorotate dehydrogenase electron transfer subunit [Bacillus sp. MUM 13]|uniref:dihydroorotate dehydrogenase electron transfer subunit n=1 Tax=Bacillus sp. MUM 13 TaxID=1678001 RepID=UPI0008F5C741|nr:dihydroorotate dehydrogenase electron transfer subunit [Bacillus sp. MUM 13]OIK15216.1 dihydroorotate dehydrogenase electron transfer subunit [Bacillus sp. MUM 13]